MKKLLIGILTLLIFLFWAGLPLEAEEPVKLVVNGSLIFCDENPQIFEGRVLVPLRTVGEVLKVKVDWQPEYWNLNTPCGPWHVYIEKNGREISLYPEEQSARMINEKNVKEELPLDVPVKLIRGRIFVPLRFIGQVFGCNVNWDEKAKVVKIFSPQEDPVKEIMKTWSNAVVTVITDQGQGSGFFFGEKNEKNQVSVITCSHVIEDAGEIKVMTNKDITYEAVVEEDFLDPLEDTGKYPADLARLRADIGQDAVDSIPAKILADSSGVEIGDRVYILGTPQGLPGSISEGIISQIRYYDEEDGSKIKVFQTTAAVSPGSSGSPVFDREGKVIGVTFAQMEAGQNLNFIIPIGYIFQPRKM